MEDGRQNSVCSCPKPRDGHYESDCIMMLNPTNDEDFPFLQKPLDIEPELLAYVQHKIFYTAESVDHHERNEVNLSGCSTNHTIQHSSSLLDASNGISPGSCIRFDSTHSIGLGDNSSHYAEAKRTLTAIPPQAPLAEENTTHKYVLVHRHSSASTSGIHNPLSQWACQSPAEEPFPLMARIHSDSHARSENNNPKRRRESEHQPHSGSRKHSKYRHLAEKLCLARNTVGSRH